MTVMVVVRAGGDDDDDDDDDDEDDGDVLKRLFSLFLHEHPVGQGDWQGKGMASLLHTPNFSYCSTNVLGSPLASALT